MKKPIVLAILLLTPSLGFYNLSMASEKHEHGSHDKHATDKSKHGGAKKEKAHHFTPHWAKTLSKKQKIAVDQMHLDLDRELAVLKAQETLKQKELNTQTIGDKTKLSTINQEIDELMAIKNKILRHRYAHLIEMRQILTAEQRLSYDMAILKRNKVK